MLDRRNPEIRGRRGEDVVLAQHDDDIEKLKTGHLELGKKVDKNHRDVHARIDSIKKPRKWWQWLRDIGIAIGVIIAGVIMGFDKFREIFGL